MEHSLAMGCAKAVSRCDVPNAMPGQPAAQSLGLTEQRPCTGTVTSVHVKQICTFAEYVCRIRRPMPICEALPSSPDLSACPDSCATASPQY